ncbi:MAG: hypothetical protein EOM87_07590 [Clostridia bacterium]|nr:hypothetical protein [Clostridia bacterium]
MKKIFMAGAVLLLTFCVLSGSVNAISSSFTNTFMGCSVYSCLSLNSAETIVSSYASASGVPSTNSGTIYIDVLAVIKFNDETMPRQDTNTLVYPAGGSSVYASTGDITDTSGLEYAISTNLFYTYNDIPYRYLMMRIDYDGVTFTQTQQGN